MKFTKISSDKAYKLYIDGKRDIIYFQSYAEPFDYMRIPQIAGYYSRLNRQWFRAREMFIGVESQNVTVRQKIHCHIHDAQENTNKIHNMIVYEDTGFPVDSFSINHSFSEKVRTAAWKAGVHSEKFILFDVDSNGEKSNFRFE